MLWWEKETTVLLILIGMLFDLLDGFAARKLQAESLFGQELDSLCDIVTFGAAPALLIYVETLQHLNLTGVLLVALFIICGAIRLDEWLPRSPYYICWRSLGSLLTFFLAIKNQFDRNRCPLIKYSYD